jgi:hypothetical protein
MNCVEEVRPDDSKDDGLDIAKHVFQVHGADASGKDRSEEEFGAQPIDGTLEVSRHV